MQSIETIGLISKPHSKQAEKLVPELFEWLAARGIKVRYDEETAGYAGRQGGLARDQVPDGTQLVVVLGGDGTLLSAARAIGGKDIPLLAVNLGGLGFLTAITLDEVYPELERAFQGEHRIGRRRMLDCELVRGEEIVARYVALNDVVLAKSSLARMIDLETHVDSHFVCFDLKRCNACSCLCPALVDTELFATRKPGHPVVDIQRRYVDCRQLQNPSLVQLPFPMRIKIRRAVWILRHAPIDLMEPAIIKLGDNQVVRRRNANRERGSGSRANGLPVARLICHWIQRKQYDSRTWGKRRQFHRKIRTLRLKQSKRRRRGTQECDRASGREREVLANPADRGFHRSDRTSQGWLPCQKSSQVISQLLSCGVAAGWIFRQGFQANRFEAARKIWANFAWPGWFGVSNFFQDVESHADKRSLSDQDLVENCAQGKDIRPPIQVVNITGRLLG